MWKNRHLKTDQGLDQNAIQSAWKSKQIAQVILLICNKTCNSPQINLVEDNLNEQPSNKLINSEIEETKNQRLNEETDRIPVSPPDPEEPKPSSGFLFQEDTHNGIKQYKINGRQVTEEEYNAKNPFKGVSGMFDASESLENLLGDFFGSASGNFAEFFKEKPQLNAGSQLNESKKEIAADIEKLPSPPDDLPAHLKEIHDLLIASKKNQDYWPVFKLKPASNKDEIKKIWLKLSLTVHPDKNPSHPEFADELFKIMIKIKEFLEKEAVASNHE